MKKTYLALTVLAMAALVSCQENEIFNNKSLDKGEVGFYLKETTTKAGGVSAIERGVILPLGDDGRGHSFVLEQTITNLDAMGPETKGTPAYTANVKELYGGKFNATVVGPSGIIDSNGEFVFDDAYGKYLKKYDDLWKDSNVPLYFYMWMPGTLGAAINSGNTLGASNFEDGKITFAYDGSLAAEADTVLAKDMTDLLFTSKYFTGLNKGDYPYDSKVGAEILFHHVFTGVKFASGNDEADDEKIKITEVVFSGLQDRGTCVVTPQAENGAYKDISDVYSSKAAAVWTPDETSPVSGTAYSTGTITGFANYSNSDYDFPASFTAVDKKGNSTGDRNFNDDNATQTLWIMPQTITAGVKLTIKYTITRDGEDEDGEWTIDFGDYFSKSNTSIKLEAGQLHTFYIKIDDVNVMIEDTVTETQKSGVVITNTGSVKSYIRAAIIGQWLDEDENPVFGFTDYIDEYEAVDSWYEDQFVKTGTGKFGSFAGLPGYKNGANPNTSGWILCKDGFYYYPTALDPTGTAEGLFTTYTVIPQDPVEVGGISHPIHFQLEISTQAVSALMTAEKEIDGVVTNVYTWQEAWKRALGYTPEKK